MNSKKFAYPAAAWLFAAAWFFAPGVAEASQFAVLHSFGADSSDGTQPLQGVTVVDSTLYGSALFGGTNGDGTLFSLSINGSNYQTLHTFTGNATDGANPDGGLTLVGSTLYSITNAGGTNGVGAIYSYGLSGGGFQFLHSFTGPDGSFPIRSMTTDGSRLYGTAPSGGGLAANGTVFSMNLDGSGFGVLHTFQGGATDGALPNSTLTLVGNARVRRLQHRRSLQSRYRVFVEHHRL